jgi:putative membrane protein insertion efficiency factor/ribonuclease P protein component
MKGTIKSKDQITKLFEQGQKFTCASMLALYLPRLDSPTMPQPVQADPQAEPQADLQADPQTPIGRVAYIGGKKLGAAPLRSRAKRRLREAAALQGAPWNGYDVVLVARKGAIEGDFSKIQADMARFANKLTKDLPLDSAMLLRNPQDDTENVDFNQNKPISRQIFGFIRDIPKNIALGCITMYRYVISPLFPPSCRYIPTCSEYALEAVRLHGFLRGSYLAVKRIGRCHPWHEGGFDPVPEVKQQASCCHK